MRFEPSTSRVFIRQSWLNDLIICPERARFKLDKPEMSGSTDATIMGTAVHYGIESFLLGQIDAGLIQEIAFDKWRELKEQPYKTTNLDPNMATMHIASMTTAWEMDIMPSVQLGGEVEKKFSFPMNMTVGEWSVWCEGTMDYVQPDGVIWDWKTASRTYYAKEKQSQAIQPTVYCAALNRERNMEYPMEFRYGVMIRQEKPKAQVVNIQRTESHERWLMHTIKPALTTAIRIGVNNNWIMNDTTALCSENWCDYWSLCKGAFLSASDLSLPMKFVPVDIQRTDS